MSNDGLSSTKRGWRWPAVSIAVTVTAVTAGGVALASIPDANGVFHGCYATTSGALRLIDPSKGQRCESGERAVKWNQTGPQGPPGPAPQIYTVDQQAAVIQPQQNTPGDVYCNIGDHVTGGGYNLEGISISDLSQIEVNYSIPVNSTGNANDGWGVDVYNTSPDTVYLYVYAECMHV